MFADGGRGKVIDDPNHLLEQARHRIDVLAKVSRRFAETALDIGVLDRIAAEIGDVMDCAVEIETSGIGTGLYRLPGEAPLESPIRVPLSAHGRILGTITALPRRIYTSDDRQLLDEIAYRAAITIENSRLYRDNVQARSRAEQLYLFAQAVVSAETLEQVFDAALESIQRALGARRAAILIADGHTSMRFRAWRGLSEEYRRVAEGQSPWPRNATAPQVVFVRDVEADATLRPDLAVLRSEAIGSLVYIPLAISGSLLGKITVYHDQPHEYSTHDLELALSIGNHLASAVRRFDAVAKLEDAVRYGELFAGILAHDLRNPLNAIMTAAALVSRRFPDDDKVAMPIGHILNSCTRMSRMIEQLLDFSRARVSGGIQVHRHATDLSEVCTQVLAEVGQMFPGHAVRLDSRGDLAGQWDRDRMRQIFSNLVVNAVQYGDASAAVGVELDGTSNEAVALRIHNQGAIPPVILPTLFDAFRSLERRRESRGLGLGLFIVRELVAAHGGTVHVTSSEEQGTTFALQLPRAARVTDPPGPPAEAAPPAQR